MHTYLSATKSETILLISSIDDLTATTARINWSLSENGTVTNFLINLTAVCTIGEDVGEGQPSNTLSTCLVGNTAKRTLTLLEDSTSATLTDLSMLNINKTLIVFHEHK